MDASTAKWTGDEPISSTLLVIGGVLLAMSFCIIFGNSLILISIRRFRRLQTLTNKFVFSLACADLSAGISIIWQAMFNFKPEMDLIGALCISRFVQIAPSYCSLMHLVVIATDRYLAILHPLRYHEFMTQKLAHIFIAIAWTLAATFTGIIIGMSRFIPGETLCMMPDVTNTVVLIVIFHVFFVILVSVLLFMYGSIFLAARKQISRIQTLVVTNQPGQRKVNNIAKELKAARQLAFIVLVFLVTHIPGVFVGIFGYVYDDYMTAEQYLVYYKLGNLIIFFNSLMNPLVYALKSKEFKEAFKRILCKPRVAGQMEDLLGFDNSETGSTRISHLNNSLPKSVTAIGVSRTIQTTTHSWFVTRSPAVSFLIHTDRACYVFNLWPEIEIQLCTPNILLGWCQKASTF